MDEESQLSLSHYCGNREAQEQAKQKNSNIYQSQCNFHCTNGTFTYDDIVRLSPIFNNFGFQITTVLTCTKCGHTRTNKENHFEISLDFPVPLKGPYLEMLCFVRCLVCCWICLVCF